MHSRRHIGTITAITAASALFAGGFAGPVTAHAASQARVALASTAPLTGHYQALTAAAPASHVQVSVFTGRNQAGLTALATAVSNPSAASYEHYLKPAQVQAEFGATAAQQRAVGAWLRGSGLTVTYRDGFVTSAAGTVAQAQTALAARLESYRPHGGTEQIVSAQAMSVPAAVAGAITTVRVAPAAIPMGQHEPMKKLTGTAGGSTAAKSITEKCSSYYDQKAATGTPDAFGRKLYWAPCGYLPQQLRGAYGATKSGLTGAGVSVAIMSEDNDSTALSDANRWARARHFPAFKPGQFTAHIASKGVPNGIGDGESALDVESVHGMAPAATVSYVVGNGKITGDRLLDALDTIVTNHIADVVSSSWYEGYMPVPQSMITAWENVLERGAVEGITVNFATGDYGDTTPLQYPGSDPWITTIGGTSVAIGSHDNREWEAGWETDESGIKNGEWKPAPPGRFMEGSTGGISGTFAEPYYQRGVVTGNVVKGKAMRAVPDVSDLGDWNLGYQIGLTVPVTKHKYEYINAVNGGTSLASPMFTGFEADLVQGRHHIALGFANPALYDLANTPTYYDITGDPQGQGYTEADVYGPSYGQDPTLSAMGECSSTHHLTCVPGYDTVSGIGTPGAKFFSSFGSDPR